MPSLAAATCGICCVCCVCYHASVGYLLVARALCVQTNTLVIYAGRINYTDTTPPVLTMIGDATTRVAQYSKYVDLGATARDDLDGDIPRFKIIVQGLPIDTSKPTPAGKPFTISYDVWDFAPPGNPAVTLYRTVEVYDPCVEKGEVMCATTHNCSIALDCSPNAQTRLSTVMSYSSTYISSSTSIGYATGEQPGCGWSEWTGSMFWVQHGAGCTHVVVQLLVAGCLNPSMALWGS